MSTPIILTKLFIPTQREKTVPRSRLVETVIKGLSSKLTLISAPAGYGKTTLLSECISKLDKPVAWISLDEGDNDETSFLSYFIFALKGIFDGFGESIQETLKSSQSRNTEILLSGIINELVEIQKPFVFVLDDYHVITNPDIHEILHFILDNQTPEMHLVISSRSDPPWPLARLRVRQEMTEIRAHDLRFTIDEATSLLNKVLGLSLSDKEIERLEAKTEGWIAGLLMAAISLQGRDNISNLISDFEGSHRFIFDYLVEEVLNQLTPELQDFLLKTSILDRLCASLCNVVLQRQDSQLLLQQVEKLNLYLFPLDNQRLWYRYHKLFSDLLLSRLKELRPTIVNDLHRRTSIWFESNGFLSEAVSHAFAANDIQRVARLAETNVLGLMERGKMGMLIQWIDKIPLDLLEDYPWLKVAQAWALAQVGSFERANFWINSVEDSLQRKLGLSEKQIQLITGHVMAIRCYIGIFTDGDSIQVAHFARQALALLPETEMRTRGMVMVFLGTVQRVHEDFPSALETLHAALPIYQTINQPYVVVDILSQIARVRREQGLLHETVRQCQAAVAVVDKNYKGVRHRLPVAAYTMGILGRVYYEWNQLDKAMKIALQALALSEHWGQANTLLGNQLLLARIFRVQGRFKDALESIRAAKNVGEHLSDTHGFVINNHEIAIRSAMGEYKAVVDWVENGNKIFETSEDERLWELAPLILTLYRANQLDSMGRLIHDLSRLLDVFERKGNYRRTMKAYILKSMVFHALGDRDKALSALECALSMGEPEGFIRSFIDQGFPMEELLKKAIAVDIHVRYSIQLLTAFRTDTQPVILETKNPPSIDELTKREKEVLHLLATGLPLSDIADGLVITIGTLRTHIKRIYDKLDAHSRFEAVTKWKEYIILH